MDAKRFELPEPNPVDKKKIYKQINTLGSAPYYG